MRRTLWMEQLLAVMQTKLKLSHVVRLDETMRLNQDLYIDSVMLMQLIVLIEEEWRLRVPEEELDPGALETVGSLLDFMEQLEPLDVPASYAVAVAVSSGGETAAAASASPALATGDFAGASAAAVDVPPPPFGWKEPKIKVHCIISCLCEIVKRYSDVDYRPFYFGVWDMPFSVTQQGSINYYTDSATYDSYLSDFEKLFGPKIHKWYDAGQDKAHNVQTLLDLLASRPDYRHIVVQIDMSLLPERENKFHQKPFPHYLMLYPTAHEDEWFMFDPDFRWEGVVKREQVIEAIVGNSFGGGFYIDALHIAAPSAAAVERFYRASFDAGFNPLTASIKAIVARAASGSDSLTTAQLGDALKQLNVLAIRKYSYDYALMFFSDALGLGRELYEIWAQQIRDLVQCYTTVQYTAIKMAASCDEKLLAALVEQLNKADAIELALKSELNRQLEMWLCLHKAGRLLP